MTWYTVHWGSWRDGGIVEQYDFGRGCRGTYSRKEAFEAAQRTANERETTVTIMAYRGMYLDSFTVEPKPHT